MTETTGMLHIRIDETLKTQAKTILAQCGLTLADAVRVLLTRVVAEKGLPAGLASDARSYDAWFKAKVQEALDDPRPRVPHDEAMKRLRTNLDAAQNSDLELRRSEVGLQRK